MPLSKPSTEQVENQTCLLERSFILLTWKSRRFFELIQFIHAIRQFEQLLLFLYPTRIAMFLYIVSRQ